MYSPFQLGIRYLKYLFSASNGKGHGVHSPFVFSFITKVLNDDRHFYTYDAVEMIRQSLFENQQIIDIEDLGVGSEGKRSKRMKVEKLAKAALKPQKFGQLLFRIVDQFAPDQILELGTSFGVTTAYLASARQNAKVITFEGTSAVADIAKMNFKKLQLDNIELVKGDFDETVSDTLKKMKTIDLAFVNGNHDYKSTIRYFKDISSITHENSILIFDDIHGSKEMEQAWEEIKQEPSVTLTIDLFFIGLVFFRKEQKVKQDFVIRF